MAGHIRLNVYFAGLQPATLQYKSGKKAATTDIQILTWNAQIDV